MRLYVVSFRTKLAALLFMAAFFLIIAVASSDAVTYKNVSTVNHFGSDELEMQDVTAEQHASESVSNQKPAVLNAVSGEEYKITVNKNAVHTLVAAAAIAANTINAHNTDDPAQAEGF